MGRQTSAQKRPLAGRVTRFARRFLEANRLKGSKNPVLAWDDRQRECSRIVEVFGSILADCASFKQSRHVEPIDDSTQATSHAHEFRQLFLAGLVALVT